MPGIRRSSRRRDPDDAGKTGHSAAVVTGGSASGQLAAAFRRRGGLNVGACRPGEGSIPAQPQVAHQAELVSPGTIRDKMPNECEDNGVNNAPPYGKDKS